MNAQHTPGPWTIGDENNQNIEVCIGDAVANLDRQDRYGLHMAFSRDEMRANGRLIAAAPELLEALQEYSLTFSEDDKERAEMEFGKDTVARELRRRAIIAKATGRESA